MPLVASRIFSVFCSIALLLLSLTAGAFFFMRHHAWLDVHALMQLPKTTVTRVLDDEGNELFRLEKDHRLPIPLSHMPEKVIAAFIAAEDHNFFNHPGICIRGIARSTLTNIKKRRLAQGASTITQQLVKILFFDSKKTFARKLKEQVVAFIIEAHYSKEQILELYLNHIYFGGGIYGVEAACQRFWGKSIAHISTAQAATLAAIVKAPSRYCPLFDTERVLPRRNATIRVMKKLGIITPLQTEQALQEPLTVKAHPAPDGYIKQAIIAELEKLVGRHALYHESFTVKTTFNACLQEALAYSFRTQCAALRSTITPELNGGAIVIDHATGAIKAMVGGFDFNSSNFNRALFARRQMGSILKPLVYACALEEGATLAQIEVDEPLSINQAGGIWQPNNASKTFSGPMTLARALLRSNNIIAIKTLLKCRPDHFHTLATAAGLTMPSAVFPALALGCIDETPRSVANYFSIFACQGIYHTSYFINYVASENGVKLWRHTPTSHRVVSAEVAGQIQSVLYERMEKFKSLHHETATPAAIGKTGTAHESRTCWFVASTPSLTYAYIGRDDNKPLGEHTLASRTTLPFWFTFARAAQLPHKAFTWDSNLMLVPMDEWTGELFSSPEEHSIKIAFAKQRLRWR
jgi:penicillin-binding protein 1A